ncbi:AAA family ATPase [Erysipelothrix sp. HDW6C]|uniref:AAA family ATPase n=1 Tax=Erysipelothrix sp. HDW6C TaxID=2714930 RepID=UPI00140E801A|nr:AAA family ATPase [Erysipelothrix sp. HDW6C]QIK70814.1 AAA family ATPase [Erysipelothrix sp. HDW6C]
MRGNYIRSIRFQEFPHHKYPFNIKAITTLPEIEFTTPVTFLVGDNGVGKSTLIEAIAVAYGFNPEGGSLHLQFETHATHSELYQYLTFVRNAVLKPKDGFFLRSESMYNLTSTLSQMGDETLENYGGSSLDAYSHGESFLTLFMNHINDNGFYILDEPESGLSPEAQMALMVKIHELAEVKGSQFFIATHSPILLSYPGATIIQLSEQGAQLVDYDSVGFVQLYRRIMNDSDYIQRLFNND